MDTYIKNGAYYVWGTGGSDPLVASRLRDCFIFAGGGNDTIVARNHELTAFGQGGNDGLFVDGRTADDIVFDGGSGKDTIYLSGVARRDVDVRVHGDIAIIHVDSNGHEFTIVAEDAELLAIGSRDIYL